MLKKEKKERSHVQDYRFAFRRNLHVIFGRTLVTSNRGNYYL